MFSAPRPARPRLLAFVLAAATALCGPAFAAGEQGEEPIVFTAGGGESVEAFRGSLEVPENRADPDSRMTTLSYVRFPATGDADGPPIIYLAGGPGGSGSGTAMGPRFPLFMAMREHGDVIAFDQRGTGDSTALPRCVSSVPATLTEKVSDAEYATAYRAAVAECGEFWRAEGVDIAGYTTLESVADLTALRAHLGAETMTLWGISYGSHLALAALDAIPEELDRVVIASAEGLDQTVKLPARTDAYFARLQDAVNTQPAAAAAYPDIAGMMRRVHARLEAEPMLLEIPREDDSSFPMLLQRGVLQEAAGGLIADPETAALLLAVYATLDAGDASLITMLIAQYFTPEPTFTLSAMPTAMDLASGISAERLAEFERQAPEALLGGYLNFPMPQISGVLPGFDLGADFRAGPAGDTPVLLLTGTLDGRTYPAGQAEAVAGLSNVTQITVRNAGHNLFMTSPDVADAMHRFMRDEPAGRAEIVVELPDFTDPGLGG